jgi:fatty acid desaturase
VVARTVVSLAALGVFLAIVIARPEFWWLIFFLPMLAGWWGWGRWHGHDEQADTRRQLRETRRRLKIQRMQSELRRLESRTHEYD